MKFSVAALLAVPALTSAFAPVNNVGGSARTTALSMSAAVVTGPKGKAASSKEEDMALTLQIIMDHEARSATVSKEQLLSQTEEIAAIDDDAEIDISIPYDAPARLAYESSDKSMDYDAFRAQYEADAVTLVKSKQPIDISIPYDAPAKLAYESTDKSVPYDKFKEVYEAEAVALVKSKQPIDISIPYDAPAKTAYESSDKSMAFDDFKAKYEADAVALVKSKQPKKEGAAKAVDKPAPAASDISIDYDAAAKLAYESTDKSMSFAEFKPAYEKEAVALVISKKPVDISVNYMSAAQLAFAESDRSMPYAEFEKKYLADAVELVKSKQK